MIATTAMRLCWGLWLLISQLLASESECLLFMHSSSSSSSSTAFASRRQRQRGRSPSLHANAAAATRPSTLNIHKENSDQYALEQSEVNGESLSTSFMMDCLGHLPNNLTMIDEADLIQPLAPPLSYDKFLRMQDKRVVVTIRYSGESGLRPYFLTVAKKLKASHPDVVIERRILPSVEQEGNGEAVFEILVDGKVVIGKKNRTRRQRVSMDLQKSRSVFVSMQELDVAISRARRRRRPTTAYGGMD